MALDPVVLVVVLLILLWATGTFIFPVGSLIHILMVVVLVLVVVRLLSHRPVP